MGRRQLADLLVDALRPRHVLAGEIRNQRLGRKLARHAAVRRQRLQLRSEDAAATLDEIVERLLAQPVPRQDELARARIPQRQREHALHALGELLSPFKIGAEHHLGVAVGRKRMPPPAQLVAQRGEVVRLAVEDEGHPIARHRLVAGDQVEDRQPPMPQRRWPLGKEALRVGPAVGDGPRRPAHAVRIGRADQGDVAADAAHQMAFRGSAGAAGRLSSSAMRYGRLFCDS